MRLLVVVGVLVVLAALWSVVRGRYLVALGTATPHLTLEDLPQVERVGAVVTDEVLVSDLAVWVRLLAWLPDIVQGAALVVAGLCAVRALRGIGKGDFFSPTVVSAVRWGGGTLIVGGLAQGALDSFASFLLATTQAGPDGAWSNAYDSLTFTGGTWPLSLVVIGVLVVAVGAAFREGARLQTEVEGVV
ncbi:DUF2975 domain-containing protein [Sanguibacter suaedae]|uniref:DUF2975 domain-containing protein n=1 Tax=Sanguibacter suaedae TaxID=2795737 RepID=A0A934I995_9MICO|nr:DUF2975 domain-containing protein [Sanguibacter suaedae]MBI9113708.1 DUF2975 domain-containing protein [Sanguibacter suaedae]